MRAAPWSARRPKDEDHNQELQGRSLIKLVQWPKSTTLRWISVRGRYLLTLINQGLRATEVGMRIACTPVGGSLREEQHMCGQEA